MIPKIQFESKMKKTLDALAPDFASVRAGTRQRRRARPASRSITTARPRPSSRSRPSPRPTPRSSLIQPRGTARPSSPSRRAIQESDLGINPQNDGTCIRLVFPQLTEERRTRPRQAGPEVRRGRPRSPSATSAATRWTAFKKKQKASEITEDDLKVAEKDLQKLTDDMCKEVDALLDEEREGAHGGLSSRTRKCDTGGFFIPPFEYPVYRRRPSGRCRRNYGKR